MLVDAADAGTVPVHPLVFRDPKNSRAQIAMAAAAAIAATSDDGTGVDTIAELQALVDQIKSFQPKLLASGVGDV
mgnify:CR=1 FL=1